MAAIEENIFGSFLPTVYISKIVLNDNRADLELFILDSVIGEELTSFLNDEILKYCLNIAIFQSTDAGYTQQIIDNDTSSNTINFVDNSGIATTILTDINFSIPKLDFKKIIFEDLIYSEIDEDGNRKFFYSIQFQTPENLDNLSYIVYSQLNLNSLQNKFGISLTSNDMLGIPKKTTIEDVIENTKLLTKSYNFLLPNGQLWTGEVIEVNDVYKTLEPNSRDLQVVESPNYKVQDFRIRKELKKNTVSESFIENANDLINDTVSLPKLRSNSTLPISSPSLFPWVSKIVNSDRSVSISLLINIEQIILQNCLYPKLLKPEMLNETQLVSGFSLWRRQIRGFNNGILELEENAEPVLIANDFNKFEVDINSANKHYLITDTNIINASDGLYQYGIEIKFKDPTVPELKNRLISVSGIRKNILEYYNFCQFYTDPNTGNFKSEVADVWDIETIEQEHIVPYLESLIELPVDFDKQQLFQSLRSYVSPITGNLDGIFLFLKLLDDLIYDIYGMIGITGMSSQELEVNEENLSKFTTKSLVDITKYFNSTIYNSSDYNKLELSYLDINSGKITAQQLSSRIYANTINSDTLYLAPESLIITNDKFEISNLEDTYFGAKEDKFLLLKNKLLEVKNNKDQYTNTDDLSFLKSDTGGDEFKLNTIYKASNDYIEKYLFQENSVVFEDLPANSDPVVKYDKIIPLNKVLSPQRILKISNDLTDVNILKDREIDLSSVEHDFKYRMLSRIEYAIYNERIKTIQWLPLTIDDINQQSARKNLNILCRLVPYDYASIGNLNIKNINEYYYNNTFILTLSDFKFVRTKLPKDSKKIVEIKNPIKNLSSNIKKIEFIDTKIGTESIAEVVITYNGSRPEDFYCNLEQEVAKNSSLVLQQNMFGPIRKDKTITIKISFRPFEQQNISTKLIIKGQRYDDVIEIPLSANTYVKKPVIPEKPIKPIISKPTIKDLSTLKDKIIDIKEMPEAIAVGAAVKSPGAIKTNSSIAAAVAAINTEQKNIENVTAPVNAVENNNIVVPAVSRRPVSPTSSRTGVGVSSTRIKSVGRTRR